MASHYYFNIELLPIKPEYGFVGADGYFKLFELLKENRKDATSIDYSFPLQSDFYFDFDSIHPERISKDHVYGKLMKFDKVDAVVSRKSGEIQFQF